MSGVGQGLERGVAMAGSFLMPVIRDKMYLDQREKLFNREMSANAGILAGRNISPTPTSAPGETSPAELLSGGAPQSSTGTPAKIRSNPSLSPFDTAPSAATPGAGPLAGVPEESFTPMSDEDVYSLYKQAEQERVTNMTKLADEQDVARGWQKTYSLMSNAKRTLMGLQNALKEESGMAAMVLVPQAQDPSQARQILSNEYMRLLQQYRPLLSEFKLWDSRRHELGIKEEEINSEPGLALYLNRLQQRSKSGSFARPGARSVVPMPSHRR